MYVELDHVYTNTGHYVGAVTIDLATAHTDMIDMTPDGKNKITVVEFLDALNRDKSKLAQYGWDAVSKHPTAPQGATRWDMLVRAMANPAAPAQVKALNLA